MSLHVYVGPMFSGKTTMVKQKITTMADIGKTCLFINHADDKRIVEVYDDFVSTHHSGYKGLSHKVKAVKTDKLSAVDVTEFEVIGVDEGQFFSKEDIDTIIQWVEIKNKRVYVGGLAADAKRRHFGYLKELLATATTFKKIHAWCEICKEKGTLTKAEHTAYREPLDRSTGSSKNVGGAETYIPLCLSCHKDHTGV